MKNKPHPELHCSNSKSPTSLKISATPATKMWLISPHQFCPYRQNLLSPCKSNWNKWHSTDLHSSMDLTARLRPVHMECTHTLLLIHCAYSVCITCESSCIYSHRFLHRFNPPRHQNIAVSTVYRIDSTMNCVTHKAVQNLVDKPHAYLGADWVYTFFRVKHLHACIYSNINNRTVRIVLATCRSLYIYIYIHTHICVCIFIWFHVTVSHIDGKSIGQICFGNITATKSWGERLRG